MILVSLAVLASSCSREEEAPDGAAADPAADPAPATAPAAAPAAAAEVVLAPVMGGIVRAVGGYVVELVARPDGPKRS